MALPYYFFRTRGVLRGAGASVVMFAGLLGCMVCALSGALTAHLLLELAAQPSVMDSW